MLIEIYFCFILFEQKLHYSLGREDQTSRNDELQNMTCVIETYTDELLFTNTGRRSLKVSRTITGNAHICRTFAAVGNE